MQKSKLLVFSFGVAIAALAWAQDARIDAAKQLFAQYVALEQAYDPAIAALYADEALIKTRRKAPMGEPRDMIIPAAQYKTLLRELMLAAEARGQRTQYTNVTHVADGAFVRIEALRMSGSRSASPLRLVVGPSASGRWLIYEELSESQ